MATELAGGGSPLTPEEKEHFGRVRAGNQLEAETHFVALRRGTLADLAMVVAGVAGSLLVTKAVLHFIPTRLWKVPIAPAIGSLILLTAGGLARLDCAKRSTFAASGAAMLVGSFIFSDEAPAP